MSMNVCRKLHTTILITVLLAIVFMQRLDAQEQGDELGLLDIYPEEELAWLESEQEALPGGSSSVVTPLFYALAGDRRWPAGSTVTIGFNGGSPELRAFIAEAASEWSEHINLVFDFGTAEARHTWTKNDTEPACDIRIGFTKPGYWSFVGIDARDYFANRATMNYGGWDRQKPEQWRRDIVVHEFGHALGFYHEHQNPKSNCEQQFIWEAEVVDGQLREGLYAYMKRVYNWERQQVDDNLKRKPYKNGMLISEHDPLSIMHYDYPKDLCKPSVGTTCCAGLNTQLSARDIEGAQLAYPKEKSAIKQNTKMLKDSIKAIEKQLTEAQVTFLEKRFEMSF